MNLDFTSILFFLILVILLVIGYVAYLKGKFNKVRRIHFLFAGLAIILPMVDVFQTLIALNRETEGNPIFLYFLTILPRQLGLALFIIVHLVFCVLGFYVGWNGKNERAVDSRTVAAFLGLLWTTVVLWNTVFMVIYGPI
jgi:hypothetical protein